MVDGDAFEVSIDAQCAACEVPIFDATPLPPSDAVFRITNSFEQASAASMAQWVKNHASEHPGHYPVFLLKAQPREPS